MNFSSSILCLLSVRPGSSRTARQGVVRRVLGVAAMCAAMLAAVAADAQTAHFSYAQSVAVSGLSMPYGVAVDSSGGLYVADPGASVVRRYAPDGSGGYTDLGTIGSGFGYVYGVAVASTGDVFVLDNGNGLVHRYSPDGSGGFVPKADIASGIGYYQGNLTVGSNGVVFIADYSNNRVLSCTPDGLGGYSSPATVMASNSPVGVAVDTAGNLYVASRSDWAVHQYAPNGSGYLYQGDVVNGFLPGGIAVDGAGAVYASEDYVQGFYRFVPNGSGGYTRSATLASGLSIPVGTAVDGMGNIYIVDRGNDRLVKLTAGSTGFSKVNIGASATRTFSFTFDSAGTIAAPAVLTSGAAGLDFTDAGTGTCTTNGTTHAYAAGDTCTVDVTFQPQLPGKRQGAAVLKTAGDATIASAYVYGVGVGPQAVFIPGTSSNLNSGSTHLSFPYQVAVDGAGNTYVSNPGSGQIVKVPAAGGSGTVVTTPGSIGVMRGIALDGAGNLFIADTTNNRIYVVPASGTAGILTIGGLATGLAGPTALVFDGGGVLYIADSGNARVVMVNLNASSLGTGSPTGAGSVLATPGYSFAGSVFPALAVDSVGTVYVSDLNNNRVIKVTTDGQVSFVSTGSITLFHPQGVGLDAAGNLYIADASQRLVEVSPTGIVAALSVPLGANPYTLTVDQSGYLLIADFQNNRVLKIDVSPAANPLTFADTPAGSTSAAQTVTLQNIGNADLSLSIPSTGNNPSISTNFSLSSSGATDCPLIGSTTSTPGTLAPAAFCTLPVSFAPTALGSILGSLVLTDNHLNASPSTTQTIPLSGTGLTSVIATVAIASATLTAGQAATPFTPVVGGDGIPPYVYSVSPALPAGLTMDGATGAISGTPTVVSSQTTYTVTVTDAASGTASATFTLAVNAQTPTLSFAAISSKTFGDAPFTVSATSASSGAVTYTVTSGPATISGNTVTLTGAGTVNLSASQAANGNYAAATATASFNVAMASPTLAFATIPQKTYGDAPFSVSATSASDGAVTYTVTSGPATISGSTVTINGIGRVILTASQAATANYNSGFTVLGLDVLAATPTLVFAAIPTKTYGDAPFAVSATSNSTAPITYFVISGPATIVGSTVTITGAGTVTLGASQPALGNYTGASVTSTLVVNKAVARVTYSGLGSTYTGSPITVTATSPSTGAITLTVTSGPATASGNTVTINGAGTIRLTQNVAGDANYIGSIGSVAFFMLPATPTLSFAAIPGKAYGDAPFAVSAASASDGGVTYSVLSGPATVAGNTVTIRGAGAVTLSASQAATTNYVAATATTSFNVTTATLNITANNATRYYGAVNPAFSGAVTGAKTGDTFAESFITTATTTSPVGTYTIVPSLTGPSLSSYSLTTTNGTLTVVQAPTVTALALSSTNVNPNQTITLTATVAPSLSSGTPTGTVTFYDNGAPLKSAGLVNGGASSTAIFASGTHTITAAYSGDTNFLPSASTGAGTGISIPQLDFSINGPATATVIAGSQLVLSYRLTPTFGTYPGPVSFEVTGLPDHASFNLSRTAIAANAGPQSFSMTVKTPEVIGALRPAAQVPWSLAFFLVPLIGVRRMRRAGNGVGRALLMLAIMLATAAGFSGLTGCGFGYVGANTRDYTVTVKATSGNVQRSTTLTLTVNRPTN